MQLKRTPSPRAEQAIPGEEPAQQAVWRETFSALGESHFRVLWLSMLPSMLAIQMGMVSVGYVAFAISGSATALGIIAAGWGLPMLLLALIGGVVADRARKRSIILCTQGAMAISAVITATLILTGLIQVWHLFFISMIQGTSFAFNMPARQAWIAQIVSTDKLMNAVALNNAGMNLTRIIGPAIAGALISIPAIGAGGVFILMASMYGVALFLLTLLPAGTVQQQRRSGASQLVEGLRYVKSQPVLRMLLALAFVPVLLGMPYVQLMPVFAVEVFGRGAQGLGVLMAVNGAGALLGSLAIASAARVARKGLLQLGLGIGFGLALAIFSFGQSFTIGLVAVALVGASASGYQTLNNTLIMQNSDAAYHGRIMSLYMMTFAAMPLGSVPMAWLVDQFTAPLTVGTSGVLLAVIVGSVALISGTYRRI